MILKGAIYLKKVLKNFLICSFLILVFSLCSFAKEYDGLWFMGFNFHKDLFQDKNVRYAFTMAIDREYIIKDIIQDENIPYSYIPPSMPGYKKFDQFFLSYDVKKAKQFMRNAGYSMKDSRIKKIYLLHTDGVKTIKIAEIIKKNLSNIGVKVILEQVSYRDQDEWIKKLESGRYHLFLMGYKAQSEFLFTEKESSFSNDPYDLLNPLFHSQGSSNLTFYSNKEVDKLLAEVDEEKNEEKRVEKLKIINDILIQDAPTVNLFYITKL